MRMFNIYNSRNLIFVLNNGNANNVALSTTVEI